MLRTAFHRLEEGTVSALTKLEAALTLRRNLPERHLYDQLSRHAAEHGEARPAEKLNSRQEEQDQACSFRRTDARDIAAYDKDPLFKDESALGGRHTLTNVD